MIVKELIPAYKSVTFGNKSSAGTLPVKLSMADKQALAFENIETKCQKIPYNQKVKQDLRRKLFFTEVSDSKINKAFDIQISELSLEAILMGFSE
ncbi:14786_t:CDS:2, partial [Funneliformis mosseae]